MHQFFFLAAACMPLASAAQSYTLPVSKHKQVVIAHRGDHNLFTENTLDAYESAIRLGVDYVETDLRTTRDDSLVILHNATLKTGDGREVNIRDLTSKEVKAITLGNDMHGGSSHIPFFSEVLRLCHNRVNLYLDFKDADVRTTYRMIRAAGMEKQVAVYVNKPEQWKQWRQAAFAMPLIGSVPDSIATVQALTAFLDTLPLAVVDGGTGRYSLAMRQLLASRKVAIWLDVQQKQEGPASWDAALQEDIQGMQTDHPAALLSYLQQHNPAAFVFPADTIVNDFYHHPEKVLVAAHRAAHTHYPENSMPALQRAIEAGIDIAELDIRETKDKVLVLMHDKNIDRTTNGKGLVSDYTYAELQQFQLLQQGVVTQEVIPTLAAALQLAKGRIMIDIDFKAGTASALQETYRLIKAYSMEQQVLFFVYDYTDAANCKQTDARVPVMPRVHNAQEVQAVLQQGGFPVMHIDDSFYTDTLMQQIRGAGLRIWSNALGDYDDKEEAAPGTGFTALFYAQPLVNIIQTNYPEQLIAFLRSKGKHR